MSTAEGIAASATRPATRRLRQRAEPARVEERPLRAGNEGWDDTVLIWNGTVAVVPEPGQDSEHRRTRRRR